MSSSWMATCRLVRIILNNALRALTRIKNWGSLAGPSAPKLTGYCVRRRKTTLLPCPGSDQNLSADCWRAIGGLIHAPGWDTVDEVKANMLGWKTRTLPDVKALHHRPTGAAYGPGMTGSNQAWPIMSLAIIPCSCSLNACGAWAKSPISSAVGGCVWLCQGYVKRVPKWRQGVGSLFAPTADESPAGKEKSLELDIFRGQASA